MHDYYPIIARAVSRLESNTPKARHELFERIRKILIDQLRIRQPPPTSSDFRRERAALEEALRRVETEAATSRFADTVSVEAPSVERSRATEGFRGNERNVAAKALGRGQTAIEDDRVDLEIKISTNRDRLPTEEQNVHVPEMLHQRMRACFADQRQQDMLSGRRSKADADKVQQTEFECSGLDSYDVTSVAASDRCAEAPVAAPELNDFAWANSKDQVQCIPSSRLSDLFSVHCLDELLRGGAEAMAPESLKRDSNTILGWLAVQNAEALKPKHYEQFTRALQAYMLEWETPAVLQTSGTIQLSLSVNDNIRAVFDRMLEREQATMVFDDALTWFATMWIGLMLALNLIVGVILIAAAPTIGAGLGKVATTYSPFNFWCWVCQVFALSPAVIAIYRKRKRTREQENARGRPDPVGDAQYRQALRLGRVRIELRNICARRR